MANTMTRSIALSTIIEFATANGFDNAEVLQKLADVQKQFNKPRKADDTKKKANLELAQKVAKQMTAGETYTNEDIRLNFKGLPVGTKGVVQPQKVSAVMAVGVTEGIFIKSVIGGKVTMYSLA